LTRVLLIENYQNTPAGLVGEALAEGGVAIDRRRAYLGEPIPSDPSGHDGLVVLGGEQTALNDADYPSLPAIADLTRKFGEADKAILGICLGAQLVARGHGAENILGRPIEFGWKEVRPTEAGRGDPVIAALNGGAPVFHWHNDTFALPQEAIHLASSAMTRHQAFRIGRAVYAIQFHFEADRKLVDAWSRDFAAVIARDVPDWPERHRGDAARLGEKADATGRAIARAWIGLLQS
jgi:GMP synthase-like glutamine amidotransferase